MTHPPDEPDASPDATAEPSDEERRGPGPDLPPRPDPETGLPRPPVAPRWLLGAPVEYQNKHLADLDEPPSFLLDPPEGKGPALEVHHGDRMASFGFAGIVVAIGIVLLVIEPELIHQLWLWPFLAAVTAVAMWDLRSTYLAAGADWLQTRGGHWVDTYRLTRIKVAAGNAQLHLHLDDADGHHLVLSDKVLLANPALWDLVHNGIRHSHAHGAELTGIARRNLGLPEDGHAPGSTP